MQQNFVMENNMSTSDTEQLIRLLEKFHKLNTFEQRKVLALMTKAASKSVSTEGVVHRGNVRRQTVSG